jgi:hypothetical protein
MLAWLRTLSRRQQLTLAIGLLVAAIHIGFTANQRTKRQGDFDVHREFGRRFLASESLYHDGLCFNYMPTSAMYYAPLALVPPAVGTVLRAIVAIACLGLTLRWLSEMVKPFCRQESWNAFTIGAWSVVLGAHYIARDLDDGGPHLILLAMLVGGIYAAWKGRQALASIWFGLAIVLKMTPGLFLPFFIWKRKWRLAAYTTLATAAWTIAPAVWLGPANWFAQQQQWNALALDVFTGRMDAARNENELRVQNQALKPAILRWLVAYPPTHPLKLDHPADVALLNLDPQLAGRIALGLMLTLMVGCAWWSRKPLAGAEAPAWLVETSAVLIAIPLFSPVTWLQHVVFVVPALYLLVAHDRAVQPLSKGAKTLMWLYVVLSLVLTRELVGKNNYLVLLSYHTHTICMLLLLGLLMSVRPTLRRFESDAVFNDTPHLERRRAA